MRTKLYGILTLLPLFTLLTACSDVESVMNRWMGEEITLDACMPSSDSNTRAGLVEIKNSKDLLAQWQDGDEVQLFACQGQVGVELGKVTVSNISSDRKRATISTVIPSSIDTNKPYTIYGFCGIEASLKKNTDGTWSPVCTAELKRSSLEDFKVPMVCRLTGRGTNLSTVEFEHFGTYELLHVANATSRSINFLQMDYNVKSPWYLGSTQVNFQSSGVPSLYGGKSDTQASDYINIPAKDTKTIISWYMASGKKLKDAQLTAYVDGTYITSQNKKSSDVTIESGHAYHLYVTWDGSSLKFDQSGVEEERSISVTPSSIDFGTVEAGKSKTETFTVYNTGNASINFVVQSLHNEFDIPESGKAVTLAAGKSKTFNVTFSPSVSNLDFQELVTITSDASNGTQYVSLYGNSKQQGTPTISVSPQSIDFGTVVPGDSKTETFTVKNTGKADLNFVIQPLHNEFDIAESGNAFTLKSGKSKSFTVTFAPFVSNLDFQEQVTITSDASNGTQYISLYGNSEQQAAEEPAINVSPSSIDFGTVEVGQSKTESFTVYNTGKVNLTFSISSLYNDFSLPESGRSFTLGAGSSKTFSVTFRPTVKDKSYSESITITSDASNGTQYVSLSGRSKEASGGGGGTSYTSCPDNNHPHMIDLGLPSGTKWACCNVGAEKPEDYGGYFAWGETSEKSRYYPDTYIHCDGSSTYHDIGKDIAGTQYDAATANWGSPWVMPNKEQMEELYNRCTSEWTTENGVKGRRFIGPNGASIFLPAAGTRWIDGLYDRGSHGYYWSSTLYESLEGSAWWLGFYSGEVATYYTLGTFYGHSVRPVRRK